MFKSRIRYAGNERMAVKKIIWSNLARSQFQDILEFYIHRNQSAEYSFKLIDQTEDLINTLSKSEFIGRKTSNNRTRVIPMESFLIFYEVKADSIEIISFKSLWAY